MPTAYNTGTFEAAFYRGPVRPADVLCDLLTENSSWAAARLKNQVCVQTRGGSESTSERFDEPSARPFYSEAYPVLAK